MPTLFTRIIDGELPGHFVWRDDRCVAFLSIHPLRPGHTLVVPRAEVDHWIDLSAEDWAHLTEVAQKVGQGIQQAYGPQKVGMMLVGIEVPHVHIHLAPIDGVNDLDFGNQDTSAKPADLAAAADRIRSALRAMGAESVAD